LFIQTSSRKQDMRRLRIPPEGDDRWVFEQQQCVACRADEDVLADLFLKTKGGFIGNPP